MIRNDLNTISLKYHSHPDAVVETVHNLLVLAPEGLDPSLVSRRLRELAHATGLRILLLGMCRKRADEPGIRRELVTLASLLQDGRRPVEIRVEPGTNWMDLVRSCYDAGDMIVCFDGQLTGPFHKPLSQVLESSLKAAVYILPGFDMQIINSTLLSEITAWLGFFVIILGFGLLQVRIVQLSAGWVQNLLLIISILPEFLLIRYWAGRPG